MNVSQFERDGAQLFSFEEGNGRVIVMLHGAMADHTAALPVVAPLSQRFRVVAPDLRGSGRSSYGGRLSFDQLVDDLEALLDHLGVERAVVGGISGGSGIALGFALRHLARTAGLILIKPIYAGTEHGYSQSQQEVFASMDAVASRALAEGVEVLLPLYSRLPPPMRDRALTMVKSFDAPSVVTTSQFIVSGAQPFASTADLQSLRVPTLLVRGDDAVHPVEVSDIYSTHIPDCMDVPATIIDVAACIGAFCEQESVRNN